MKADPDLHPAVRIVGETVVITEDNVTLTQDDVANIIIELHRRGADMKEAYRKVSSMDCQAGDAHRFDPSQKIEVPGGDRPHDSE